MRLLEIYVWNCLYWALYLPCSFLLYLFTGQGDVLGILFVGGIITAILTVYLSFSEGVLFDEEMEPAIVLSDEPEVEIEEVQTVEVEEDEKEQTERIDLESEPKMRTDVDLGQLDADDDDLLS